MGSRKLILLPQVLPMHTFYSAYHVLPYDASLCLAEPFHAKIYPCEYPLTRSCPTWPCSTPCLALSCQVFLRWIPPLRVLPGLFIQSLTLLSPCLALSCLIFLRWTPPLRVLPDLVIPSPTLLGTVSRTILPSLSTLSSTLASFTRPSHTKPDLTRRSTSRCLV